jgi:hypothetical protein
MNDEAKVAMAAADWYAETQGAVATLRLLGKMVPEQFSKSALEAAERLEKAGRAGYADYLRKVVSGG